MEDDKTTPEEEKEKFSSPHLDEDFLGRPNELKFNRQHRGPNMTPDLSNTMGTNKTSTHEGELTFNQASIEDSLNVNDKQLSPDGKPRKFSNKRSASERGLMTVTNVDKDAYSVVSENFSMMR